MQMAGGWGRALAIGRSTPVVLALLIAGNLVPLLGVLVFGWDVATILVLYWVENGIVGVLNVPRMLLAQAPDPGPPNSRPVWLPGKLLDAVFFTLHYGLFWGVHGYFVITLTGFARLPGRADLLSPLVAALENPVVLLGSIGLLFSQASALYYDFLKPRAYRHVSPSSQQWRPYPRLVVLHLTITAGGVWLVGQQSQPVAVLGLLVLLKTVAELAVYLIDRRRAAAKSPAGANLQA